MPYRQIRRSKLYTDLCLPFPSGTPVRERLIEAFENFVELYADQGHQVDTSPIWWIGLKAVDGVSAGGRGTYRIDGPDLATLIAVEIFEGAAPGPLSDYDDPANEFV